MEADADDGEDFSTAEDMSCTSCTCEDEAEPAVDRPKKKKSRRRRAKPRQANVWATAAVPVPKVTMKAGADALRGITRKARSSWGPCAQETAAGQGKKGKKEEKPMKDLGEFKAPSSPPLFVRNRTIPVALDNILHDRHPDPRVKAALKRAIVETSDSLGILTHLVTVYLNHKAEADPTFFHLLDPKYICQVFTRIARLPFHGGTDVVDDPHIEPYIAQHPVSAAVLSRIQKGSNRRCHDAVGQSIVTAAWALHQDEMWRELLDARRLKHAFDRYSKVQSAAEHIVERVCPLKSASGRQRIIFFGAASFKARKGHASCPRKKVIRVFACRAIVAMTSEWGSTCRCPGCGARTTMGPDYRTRECTSTPEDCPLVAAFLSVFNRDNGASSTIGVRGFCTCCDIPHVVPGFTRGRVATENDTDTSDED
ncbi:hypothetical protein JKP88DRAFT_328556 [Tribonema minus]|uniref:Uncharacterized protein n=1 Tax=Tribonema minus TaxID=303371 RepID=A0A836CAY1_9STRA|nr:hypothetical protein JKP88DRAFT_328556 [Tribonema minus]